MLDRISLPPTAAVIIGLGAVGALAYDRLSTRRKVIRVARRVVPGRPTDPKSGLPRIPREHALNKLVGQGRGFWKEYSGCGDLWNFVLDEVGAPNTWVNRDSTRRGLKWKQVININKPYEAALKAGAWVRYRRGGPLPKAGDLVLIGREPEEIAHVFVVVGRRGRTIETVEFDTGEYGASKNAGVRARRKFDSEGRTGEWHRHLVGWIDADKIPVDPKYRRIFA